VIPPVAFYCVCDSRYFLGAVAMLNSLRLVGHDEPAYLLDCGLTDSQRDLLAPKVTLVSAPEDEPPWLVKPVAPLRYPAEVMVLIDADMIITRPLTPLVAEARRGKVVAFENDSDRFFPEWGDALELGTARPRQYVSSSLVCLGGPVGCQVLRLMAELRDRVDFSRTLWRAHDPDYPFLLADQDILNAILTTTVDPAAVTEADERLEAVMPFTDLRVVDENTLRCEYDDGTQPFAIHDFLPGKSWLEPPIPGVYPRLLTRLLRRQDVDIRVPKRELPPHLRPGLAAAARRVRRDGLAAGLRSVRARIGRAGQSAGG
jgi:hypothetical protein